MAWYENAVIYQIYPRSYMDSNGDGIGDLNGIISKLPYIKSLGVDAIWLSPIYQSPMKDFGYDISDYRAIDPIFGNIDDLKTLVSHAHELGLKIMMDMVLNHTSDKHKWFVQSELRDSKYSDFYIWSDTIPNNWVACFGGKAWTYSPIRKQYYLHSYLKEQPDLNWHNAECRKAIFDEVRFYLDMGIDGFRLDVINLVGKDPQLRNNPWMFGSTPRPYDMQNHVYDRNTEFTHQYIRELRSVIEEYDDRALLGEIQVQGKGQMEMAASYLGKNNDELQLSFEFSLCNQKLIAQNIRNVTSHWYDLCSKDKGRTPCWVLSNHDVPRAITRAHNSVFMARLLTMWLLLQRGSSVVYMGEEIGMLSPPVPKAQIQDPVGKRYWPFHKGRDGERRPMQWDSSENMGFSSAKPWLEPDFSDGWQIRTVREQETDSDSLLQLFRAVIKLRKERNEITSTDAKVCANTPNDVLAYSFEKEGKITLVVLNMSQKEYALELCDLVHECEGLSLALSSHVIDYETKLDMAMNLVKGKIKLPKGLGVVLTN
ncbi:MAG: alpha-amylase family glycosyl hydrolase [Sphaerochaetaceae bacterium]|nr:alpha-amylase family glycosyl hydrolase [Sphaerochaetaceae bacterium]